MTIVKNPADFQFRNNDTSPTRVDKLENLRLFAIGVSEFVAGGIRRSMSDQLETSGPHLPRSTPPIKSGDYIVVPGEGETLVFDSDIALGTRLWLDVGTDQTFTTQWRVRVRIDDTPNPTALVGFQIFDADGRFLGRHKVATRNPPWTVSSGQKVDTAKTTSAEVKAQYPTGTFVRGFWARTGGSFASTNVSLGLIVYGDAGEIDDLRSAIITEQIRGDGFASQITAVQARTAAYVKFLALAGMGRAELQLWADANGGGGVNITGDLYVSGSVQIDGNTSINGTLTGPKLANLTVDTPKLSNNSVSVPLVMRSGAIVYGSGSYVTLVSGAVTVSAAGLLLVQFSASHVYNLTEPSFDLEILVNGVSVQSVGGGKFTLCPTLTTAMLIGAGTYTVTIRWRGANSDIYIIGDTTLATGFMK